MLAYTGEQIRQLRWRQASMVFQSAMNSLNPVMRIDEQFFDTLIAHGVMDAHERQERVAHLLQFGWYSFQAISVFPPRVVWRYAATSRYCFGAFI